MWWAYTRGGAYIRGGLIVGGLRYRYSLYTGSGQTYTGMGKFYLS